MSKIWYTLDADGDSIEVDATIESATQSELDNIGALLSKGYGLDWRVAGWKQGKFTECWIRVYRAPELDKDGFTTIGGIRCSVKEPDQHNGHKLCWWLTPVEPVYVPLWTQNETSTKQE